MSESIDVCNAFLTCDRISLCVLLNPWKSSTTPRKILLTNVSTAFLSHGLKTSTLVLPTLT